MIFKNPFRKKWKPVYKRFINDFEGIEFEDWTVVYYYCDECNLVKEISCSFGDCDARILSEKETNIFLAMLCIDSNGRYIFDKKQYYNKKRRGYVGLPI